MNAQELPINVVAANMYRRVCEQVRACEVAGRAVIPTGTPPGPSDSSGAEYCDLRPLSAVVDHAHADMTITVQAGLRVAALQSALLAHRQTLPLDAPVPEQTSVGGLIAANLSGSRRLGAGTARDQLIGIRVVGAGGELIRGGGRVVKNVAGYDLCKLYVGSRGWLGVIVEATFKVAAVPQAAGAAAIACESADAAEALCAALLGGETRPASLDLLDRAALRFVFAHTAAQQEWPTPFVLLAGYEGVRAAVDWQIAQCRGPGRRVLATFDAGSLADARQRIVDFAYGAAAAGRAPLRASVPSSAAAALVAAWAALSGDGVVAHAASGIVCASFLPRDVSAALAHVSAAGGAWTLTQDSAADALRLPLCGPPRGEWAIMRKVKQALDPQGVFTPHSAFARAIGELTPPAAPPPDGASMAG